MANNKKRELREKNDTILKMFILSDTMHLTNEEFGALIRKVMREDDRKDKRYEELKGFVLNEFLKKEQEWEKSFNELTEKNKTMISAFSTVYGQANKSHNSFLSLSKQYDNDNDDSDGTQDTQNDTQDDKTNTGTETPTEQENGIQGDLEGEEWETKNMKIFNTEKDMYENWLIEYQKKNEKNIPSEEIQTYEYDEIIKIMNNGYEDSWNQHWKNYLEE